MSAMTNIPQRVMAGRRASRLSPVLLVVTTLALPALGRAQVGQHRPIEATDMAMQRMCPKAAAALLGKPPERATEHQRELLEVCEISAPPIVAQNWKAITAPGPALASLIDAARYIRDERIFGALAFVAKDESRDPRIRIVAMNVLASYAVFGTARWPLSGSADGISLSLNTGTDTLTGSQPVTGVPADRVDGILQEVVFGSGGGVTRPPPSAPVSRSAAPSEPTPATVSTDPQVYAKQLRDELHAYVLIRKFPIRPPNVTLRYVCGNTFRVRNMTPFALALPYDMDKDKVIVGEVRVGASSGSGDFVDATFTTATTGTVRIFYIGAVLASRANGGTTCPP